MIRNIEVTAVGEILIDFMGEGKSHQGNPLFEANPGGAPLNVLAMLRKLGHLVAFIGKVGEDMFGKELQSTLQTLSINDVGLFTDPIYPTTLSFVSHDSKGERSFSFLRNPGADCMLTKHEALSVFSPISKVFHFGSLSMTHPLAKDATIATLEKAKQNGALISFDPNLRPLLWQTLFDAKEAIFWGISQSDFVKLSLDEMTFLCDTMQPKEGAAMLLRKFPNVKLLCITDGANGSFAFYNDMMLSCPAFPVNAVDSTGAGDAFCGVMLHFLLENNIDTLTEEVLAKMLRYGNAAGALIVQKKGTVYAMPSLAQIEALLAENQ